ncbi:MAG: hypothetical protein HYR60_13995 [Acidobacteria bacterium]|nr:hypothetical protein [Acidobacteriota bacterium]MBI3472489.1 hypothetical protein [Candidatus Solibacter usitatus]
MSRQPNVKIAPAEGKLGVLIPGLGAVATLRWMQGEDLITHLGLEYYD